MKRLFIIIAMCLSIALFLTSVIFPNEFLLVVWAILGALGIDVGGFN